MGECPTSRGEADTEQGPARVPGPTPVAQQDDSAPTLERFTLLDCLGDGGVGTLYSAYDPKLDRKIALRVLHARGAKVTDDTRDQRMVAEARAMAKLSHPNVVTVFEVGDAGGEVEGIYVAMEYVDGVTLRRWVDEQEPTWTAIVSAYVAAGRGLAAVHEAGLVHRDFKPDSVIVDGQGGVRVMDVGVDAVVGTAGDMAPEQLRGEAAGPKSDQYAFCAALYEALWGARPSEDSGALSPPASEVPGDIRAAVLQGLARDPESRWSSMQALLDVLGRDRGVSRTRWAMLGVGVTLAAFAAIGGYTWHAARAERCSGAAEQLAGVWGQDQRSEVEAAMKGVRVQGAPVSYAARVWERSASELDAYADAWTAMHTEACEATVLRQEQSVASMDLRMTCLHQAKLDLKAVVQILATADAEVMTRAHTVIGGLTDLGRCADEEALLAAVEPPREQDAAAVDTALALVAESRATRLAGRYAEALERVESAKDAVRGVDYPPLAIELGLAEGHALDSLGKKKEAELALVLVLQLATARQQWAEMQRTASLLLYVVGSGQKRMDEALSRYRMLAERLAVKGTASEFRFLNNLGNILKEQGKYPEAEATHRRLLALREEALGPEHVNVIATRNNLANVLQEQGKLEEAEAQHRHALGLRERILGPDHPHVALSRNNLGIVLFLQGKYKESEAENRQALALRAKVLGPEHPFVAYSHGNLAVVLQIQGKQKEAETQLRQVASLLEQQLGADHLDVATARSNLGTVLYSQGKHAEAEAEYRASLALRESQLEPGHPLLAASLSNVGNALYTRGNYADAETHHRRALESRINALGPEHADVATSHSNLGGVLRAQGRRDEAEAEHRRALAIRVKMLGPEHTDVAISRHNLGLVLHEQHRHDEAESEYRRGLALWERAADPEHPGLAASRSSLAALLLDRGRAAEALEVAEQAWSRRQRDDIPPNDVLETALVLAKARWQTAEDADGRARAVGLAQRVADAHPSQGQASSTAAADLRAWLRNRPAP